MFQVGKLCTGDPVDISPHNELSITANDATVKDMEVIFQFLPILELSLW